MPTGDFPKTSCGVSGCRCNGQLNTAVYSNSGATVTIPGKAVNFSNPGIAVKTKPESFCVSETIKNRIKLAGARYHASDNISEYIEDSEKELLIQELTQKFEAVLQSLIIDTENDPNSQETAHRLAKMYINETMAGRYNPPPKVTAFPNDDVATRYRGLLITRCEFRSICSHHHQPVKGVAFVGLLPSTKVIGLSKYSRIVDWCARRGTLQEEMTKQVADEIMKHTGSEDVAVHVIGIHGCMENRGVMAHSSATQTTVLHGQFYNPSVKDEFFHSIKLQQSVEL